MKKVSAVLLSVLMLSSLLTSCGSSGGSSSQASVPDTTAPSGKRVSIEIVSGDAVQLPAEAENFMNKALSDAIGADVTYTILGAGSDYATALNVRLTGGDTPDIFAIPNKPDVSNVPNKQNMRGYVDNGILMSLTPYLDQLKPVLDFTGEVRKADMYKDELYLLPKQIEEPFDALMIRNDWVTAVGGQNPTTPQEMLELCKDFTLKDPDGNGKKDTYGLSGQGLRVFNAILYTYDATVDNDIIIRDGKVTSSLQSPYMKEGLEMCKAFVDAGVVDPDLVSNNSSSALDKAIQGVYGMSSGSYAGLMRPSNLEQALAVNPKADWGLFDALTGPAGKSFSYLDVGNTQSRFVVGKHVEKDPEKLEKVLELFNYLVSEEGQRVVCYGIEKRHYNIENGVVVPTELMSSEANFAWAYQLSGRNNATYLEVKFPAWKEIIPFANSYPYYQTYNSAIDPPEGFYVEDFNKYVTEEITKFIYGQRPISEYDAFLGELESMFKFSEYMSSAEQQIKDMNFI